ncbi:MAG: sigma-70 family RNA polymerase sigma factor [Deltaproteobacteria bacterium]|nr:sigma-70 family RNA polymerase sigma factor [Deltaproteobacteria bacterium]
MRLTRNPHDAQDLVQETYLRAYSAWERFEPADCHRQAASSESPGSCARPWLVRIMTNSFINQYRRGRSHKRFVQRPGDEPMSAFFGDETRQRARDPESWYLHDSMGDELTSALASLPDGYRKIVLLACVEELKYREIADMLGIPVGTVMSRLFRARQKLEEKLASHVVTEERLRAA